MAKFNSRTYFDESDSLVSLGPFFGGDAADKCMKSLERFGLTYTDDFFIFDGFVPNWYSFEVFCAHRREASDVGKFLTFDMVTSVVDDQHPIAPIVRGVPAY